MSKLTNPFAVTAISVYQSLAQAKTQLLISVFGYASVCRHQPSCSQYTQEQIKKHGTIVGLCKGIVRVATCW